MVGKEVDLCMNSAIGTESKAVATLVQAVSLTLSHPMTPYGVIMVMVSP